MGCIKIFLKCLLIFLLIIIFTFSTSAQITNEAFKKADEEYYTLSSEINRLHNEMSKASEAGDNERYTKIKADYEKAAADRKKFESIRKEFQKQNKELVGIKKIFNEGNAAYKLGKTQEALTKYDEAINKGIAAKSPALDETISKASYGKGLVKKNQKKLKEAIDAFSQAAQYTPSYYLAYYARGNAYGDINEINLAIKDYQEAIELNNSYHPAYFNLGTIFLKQSGSQKGRSQTQLLDKAEAAFRDAVRINPKYYQALTYLGRVLTEKKRAVEAITPLNQSIKIRRNYSLAYHYLAVAYNQLNDPNSAIMNAETCLKYRRNFSPAYIEMGDAYLKKGNESKAIEAYKGASRNRAYRKLAEYKIDMIVNKDKYIQ